MDDIVKSAWAGAIYNGDFICVETYSGYRSSRSDPKGAQHLLIPDVSNEELGIALLDALAHSRFVLPEPRSDVWVHPEAEFDSDLYDYKRGIERYAEWTKALMKHYGYKTKRALFKNMKSCNIESQNGTITIRPSYHEKLEMWSGDGISKDDYVVIPANSSPDEIGAALKLAFGRCT